MNSSPVGRFFTWAALLAMAALPVRAASFTWTGSGSDSNWTSVANWSGTGATNFDGTQDVFFAPTGGLGSGSNTVLNGNKTIRSLTFNTNGTVIISGDALTLQGGALTNSTFTGLGVHVINSSLILGANGVFSIGGSSLSTSNLLINGSVGETGGSRSLTITGNRAAWFYGNNTYTGPTIINNSGKTVFAGSNSTSQVTVNPGGQLWIANNNALGTGTFSTVGGIIGGISSPVVPNAVQMQGTNSVATGSGRITFAGQITMVGNLQLDNSNTGASGEANAMVLGGGFTDNGSNFSLTFIGAQTRYFIISNASSYSGGTIIDSKGGANNVIVKLAADNGLGTNGPLRVDASDVATGSFNLNGFKQTVGALSGTGTIALGSGTLVTGDGSDSTFAGYITGAGGTLVKKGTGVFTLGGSNAYTGGTIVSNGTLRLGVQTAILSNRAVTVAGGTYDLGGFAAVTNGTMTLSSGAISNGTLVSSSNLLATDSGTIFANLAGNGGLIKTGAGTLSLNGNSSQAGATRVSNGVLRVNGVLSGTAGLSVASNATLGGTGSVRGVNIANGGWLAPGNSIGTLTVSNLTLNTGSLFDFELAATNASDQVVDLGTLALAQLDFSNFSFTTNAGFGAGSYVLVDATAHSSTFNPVTNASFYGYLGTISLGGTDGNDLILNVALAIPEPSALLALALGTAGLALLRRRNG